MSRSELWFVLSCFLMARVVDVERAECGAVVERYAPFLALDPFEAELAGIGSAGERFALDVWVVVPDQVSELGAGFVAFGTDAHRWL